MTLFPEMLMRYAWLLFLLALSTVAPCQQTPPTGAPASTAPTIRTGTQIVILDVNVLSSNGQAVHSLRASDFTVLENGIPQPLDHLEEHKAPATAARLPQAPHMDPGIYTNYSVVPEDGPLNILLVDTLNTPMQSQMMARQKMLAYLREMKPNQRVAIFGLSSRLYLLQGFTSNPALLQAALSGKRAGAKTSPLLGDPLGTETASDQLNEAFGNTPLGAQVVANLQQFEATVATEQIRDRALITLTAMNQLARYLSGLSGRKNLVWLSGSFPLNVLPNGDLPNPFSAVLSMQDSFRETTNLLARAQVAVYPVDARGLFNAPMLDASVGGGKYVRNPTAFGRDMQKFSESTIEEHGTMIAMADATGGKAYVNTNDLGGAVNDALNAGANYYTLVYTPTNRNWNGGYRKIEVRSGNGLKLNYRRGYYADDPAKQQLDHATTAATQSAASRLEPLSVAMQRGAPEPTQILFKALIVPGASAEDKLAEGNIASSKSKPPYRTFSVYLAGNPADLEFRTLEDGKRASSIRFATVVYDQDGQPITLMNHLTQATVLSADYNRMLQKGVQYSEQISVPAKGNYFIRIGMEDMFSGKVGAIEVPTNAVPIPATKPAEQPH
jgi:VWFA-related protein